MGINQWVIRQRCCKKKKKNNMAAVEDVTVGLPSLQFEAALTQEEKYLYFFYNYSNSSPGTG